MKKFSEDSTCPKCNQGAPASRFCPGDETVQPEAFTTPTTGPLPPNRMVCFLGEKGEHIHRVCGRCGFEWAEKTLDSTST